ncbi:MAG: SH3 domain-containing protein, partial [Thermomicrobiales bacterium]
MRIATCGKDGRSYRRRRRGEKGAGLPGTGISLLLGVLLLVAATPLTMLAPVNDADAAPAAETDGATDLRGQASRGYRVFATREGLVGGYTSNGHLITPWDYFVSLPACTSMSCPGASPGRSGFTNCGSLCYVKVTNPATGACRTEPVIEVGPWFTVDDWWNPADVRFLNKLPSNRQILPQGYPGAQAAWEGKNVGYGWGSNGIGGSDYYSSVGNQAAIDLADGTYWSLGIGGVVGNWVDVEMLWQTGESPSAAAASCGHQLGKGGGAIPKWTPTPTTPTPTIPLITWGTARVTGTGGSGLNCRTAPSGSGTVIAVLAEGATVTLRGPAVSGWYPVICAGQAGYASASYLTTTTTPTPTITPTRTTTATASPTVTGTPTSTATVSPTATGTATGTPTSTTTTTPASLTPSPTGTTTATETTTVVPTTETPSPTASTTATATGTPTPTAPSSSPTATIRPTVT